MLTLIGVVEVQVCFFAVYFVTYCCILLFSGSVFGLKKWDYWSWIEALINHLQNDKYVNSTTVYSI